MTDEQDNELCTKFPLLYADRHQDMMSTCMCWGFETGTGWFDLIYRLSEKLEAEIMKLPEDKRHLYKAAQVKEKFGGLRFYMTADNDAMSKLIDAAESEAEETCESCGSKGKGRNHRGWFITLCENCEAKHDKEQ